jgi:hypothetical protein
MEIEQLKCSMDRYKINIEKEFRSLVPIYTLIMDILNFELMSIEPNLLKYLYDLIKERIDESSKELNKFLSKKKFNVIGSLIKENKEMTAIVCEVCMCELFNYYTICKSKLCKELKDKDSELIMCFNCLDHHCNVCANNKEIIAFYKYSYESLDRLLYRIEKVIGSHTDNIKLDFYEENFNNLQEDLCKINTYTQQMARIKLAYIEDNQLINEKINIYNNLKKFVSLTDNNKYDSISQFGKDTFFNII